MEVISTRQLPDLKHTLNYYQNFFNPEFKKYFDTLKKSLSIPVESKFIPLGLDLISDLSLSGGKRQRVAFLYEAYKLVKKIQSEEDKAALLVSALSIELLQSHLLIHDDIVDNAPTRRSVASTYYALMLKGLSQKSSLGSAIMLGDITLNLAVDVITRSSIKQNTKLKLIDIQLKAGIDTFLGQIYDLERDELNSVKLKNNDLYVLADYKAVRSSVLAPMLMGLSIAGAAEDIIQRIAKYALFVGIAGQLQDDYLGVFGDPDRVGKSTYSDILEGKQTLLIKHLLERCSLLEAEKVRKVLGNSDAKIKDINTVVSLMKKYKSDLYIKRIAKKYAIKAFQEVDSWPKFNVDALNFFKSAALWFVDRDL